MIDHLGDFHLGPASWSWIAAWQNAFLFFIDIALVLLFAAYLVRRIEERASVVGLIEALRWRSPSTDASAALTAYFAGMAWVRAALWLVRFEHIATETSALIVAIGLAVSIAGVTCLLRVFAAKPWGTRVWLISVAADLLLSTLLTT